MGKVRRARQKFHAAASKESSQKNVNTPVEPTLNDSLPLLPPADNIFAGLNISFDTLKKNLSDDTRSVKSYKSTKSELGSKISKKDKLKLRHNILLQKVDTVNQLKKEQKKRKKRKTNAIIGDTNALHDALPSLDSLLKNRDFKINVPQAPKKKGIAKQSKRKKNVVEGVNMFRQLLANKQYKKDPLKVISDVVKHRVKSGNL